MLIDERAAGDGVVVVPPAPVGSRASGSQGPRQCATTCVEGSLGEQGTSRSKDSQVATVVSHMMEAAEPVLDAKLRR